jgi:hypothetical protein
MPKSTRRATFTTTVTYTFTADFPGQPEKSSAEILTLAGGANGASGTTSLGTLLSGSVSNNGTISAVNWAVSGSPINVEPFTTRVPSFAMTIGQRLSSVSPPSGNETALSRMFVVRTAGTTGAGTTEPTWNTTIGATTADGTVTFMAVDRFAAPTNYSAASITAGTIVRPTATSMKEFLVTTTTTFSGTPTWTSMDTVGQTGGTNSALLCIAGAKTYAALTVFNLGDVVKPTAGSSDEYLVTLGGKTDTTSTLTATVGNSVTLGGVTFKRIM